MKIKVQHILVRHGYEAEDLVRKIKSGADFGELAQKYSTCPSAPQQGHLGEIDPRRLDDDFREALMTLKIEEISNPVRTRFGYHLIRRLS